jgi:hypothetical protein
MPCALLARHTPCVLPYAHPHHLIPRTSYPATIYQRTENRCQKTDNPIPIALHCTLCPMSIPISPQHATRNPQPTTHNPQRAIRTPQLASRNSQLASRNTQHAPLIPKSTIRNLQSLSPSRHPSQFFNHRFHVRWYRRFKPHTLARMGMDKSQPPGMQHLSGYRFEQGEHRRRFPRI